MGMIMPKDGSADVCEAWEPCGSCFGVGLEEVVAVLPEPAIGSKVEVRVAAWDKLVAEVASCLGMCCR